MIILGATGSIGESTCKVLRSYPDLFTLTAITYHSNFERAREIHNEFAFAGVCSTGELKDEEKKAWKSEGVEIAENLETFLQGDYDIAVVAIVGAAGVAPTVSLVEKGKVILLANKESMVIAGELLLHKAKLSGSLILPIDSEHNSLFRLLRKTPEFRKLTITASGGALRDIPVGKFESVDVKQVLRHPTWDMGAKITVDSATMVNKALEIIEAHYFFNTPYEQLGAVIHPESLVHAMVEDSDGSHFMHLYHPDMVYSIAYCLFYPEPPPMILKSISYDQERSIHFSAIDHEKYPGYYLGVECGRKGGYYPAVFNAANEVAVHYFLNQRIRYLSIIPLIENVLEQFDGVNKVLSIETLVEADRWAREKAAEIGDVM